MSIGRIDGHPSVVLWFTGLSGAGKSTIGSAVVDELRRRGIATEYLDGDRGDSLFSPAGFSRDDRDAHVEHLGFLASRLETHGITVVCALISPYADAPKYVTRAMSPFCRNLRCDAADRMRAP